MLNFNMINTSMGFKAETPDWYRGERRNWFKTSIGNCTIHIGRLGFPDDRDDEYFINVYGPDEVVDSMLAYLDLPFNEYVEKDGTRSADMGDGGDHEIFYKALKLISKEIFAQPMKLESGLTGWRQDAFNNHEQFVVRGRRGRCVFYDAVTMERFLVTSPVKKTKKFPSGTMVIETESGTRYSVTL